MNGDLLAVRVREILRDVETVTQQGSFWSDQEVRLALNQSQEIFINTALRLKLQYLLAGLHVSTGFIAPVADTADPAYFGGWIPLPADYMHYVSGLVGEEEQYLARIYLGATAEVYRNAGHAGIVIVNQAYLDGTGTQIPLVNAYRGILANDPLVAVNLHYFRRPYYIGMTALGDDTRPDFLLRDFPDYVYSDIIVGHAAVMLGMKETQTQREFKVKKNIFSHYNIFPKRLLNLLNDVERIRELIESMMGKQEG